MNTESVVTESTNTVRGASVTLVAFHASCPDGYGAASAFAHNPNTKFFPVRFNNPNPEFWNALEAEHGTCRVYVLDFCFPRAEMERIASMCEFMTWIDHHESAMHDEMPHWFNGTDADVPMRPSNVEVIFDLAHSGAYLAYMYQFRQYGFDMDSSVVPELIRYIEDRDLWRLQLPNSRAVNAGLFDHMCGFHSGFSSRFRTTHEVCLALHELAMHPTQSDINSIRAAGEVICRKIDSIASRAFANRVVFRIGNHSVFGAFSTEHVSDCGDLIAERTNAPAVVLSPLAKEMSWIVHIRSYEGLNTTAKDLALCLGGGGQKHAAGAKIHWTNMIANPDGSFTLQQNQE
jgi:oligoribonuclease NrnB/cAMP/cGMP phosphodiesterase (DHH superfamily)